MLENLDKINWAGLSHANGSAVNIPDLIRQLASADETIRRTASAQFTADILPNGVIYEASSYTIPFLIDLLEKIKEKHNILSLIRRIACGITPYEAFISSGMYNEKISAKYEREKALQLDWVQKCYTNGREGLDLYYGLINHPHPQTRNATIRLITIFREADTVKTTSKKLYDRFLIEEDRSVKAELIRYLGFITTPYTIESDLINSLLIPNLQDDYLPAVAAVSLARIFTVNAPELVISLLVNTISQPSKDIFGIYVDTEEACEGLQALGIERAIPALIQALCVAKINEDIFVVTRFLLDLAFKDYKQKVLDEFRWEDENNVYHVECHLDAGTEQLLAQNLKTELSVLKGNLNTQQYQVLKAIVEQRNLWQEVATNLYKVYGLPTTLMGIKSLID